MSGRFFLDTNIFVYLFDAAAREKSERARQLLEEAIGTRRGIVSYQVVQEFFNVALRRFVSPLTAIEAEHFLATVFLPLLTVHSSPGLFLKALQLSNAFHFSWYDSLVIAAALEGNCDVLYSEDLQQDQNIEGMRISNPFK
jgi:predicted nucleic acid-binding protein